MLKGYQTSAVDEGKLGLRFLFGVETLNWGSIGMEVTVNGRTASVEGTAVYTSVLGYDENGMEETYTAESLGANYLAALSLVNVPAEGTYTITVKAFALEAFGENGIKNYGTVCTVTVTNGTVTAN